MYTTVGGTSVYEESALQRHFRDVHVASQHMMVAEPVLELAGARNDGRRQQRTRVIRIRTMNLRNVL